LKKLLATVLHPREEKVWVLALDCCHLDTPLGEVLVEDLVKDVVLLHVEIWKVIGNLAGFLGGSPRLSVDMGGFSLFKVGVFCLLAGCRHLDLVRPE